VPGVTFFFGDFELDASTYKLRRAGSEIPLQPKVFDAIRYLIEHHDRVVRKEELLDALWPGEHVNDTAVPWTISRARKVLGQGPDANQPIETVRGRGYRFTGELRQAGATEPPPSSASPGWSQQTNGARTRAPSDPFVGRGDTIERLLGALHEASSGRGRLCLLTGEAGIGKTRCTNEFATMARRLKLSVWTGRCLEGGRTAAFWPWVQVLRDALGDPTVSSESREEIQSLLAELSPTPEHSERVPDVEASSAVAARFWVLEKLSRVLLKCAESHPRVVLLDDVHWGDEASLDLLIFLAAELSQADVLVVATARDVLGPGSEAWAKTLSRLGPCERIELSGLKPTDVENYVAEVTGLDLPPEIHRTVYTKCGGNPLFLQETARLIAALGERGGARSLSTDDITVPGVARDVLRARLTGLPPETCAALEVACVIGQDFELPVLQGALGIEAEKALVRLDEAVRARLVAPRRRAATYGFTHDTIREALYEELPAGRRVELHERVGRALEERSGGDLRLNDLAFHYYRALPRAAPAVVERYARMAGEAAMRGFAYEDASQFFGWALEAQRFRDAADARSHCELLLMRATSLRLSGRVRDAQKSVERVIDIARENRDAGLLAEAARKLRPFYAVAMVPDPVALNALEDASRLVSKDQRSLRIRVLGMLACIPPYSQSIEKSQQLSGEAVALAREGADAEDLIEALKCRLHALSGPDHIEELLEVTDEILHLAAYRSSLHRGEAEVARYHALLHKGDMTGADRALEEIGRIGRALQRPETIWHYQRDRAQWAFHTGDFQTAQTAYYELNAKSLRLRLPYSKFFFMMQVLAMAYERTGVGGLISSTREWRNELEWASSLGSFQAGETRFLFEIGRVDEARRAFDSMAQMGFENITREIGYLNALSQLSLVAVALEDRERAEQLYDLLSPYPHHNTPTSFGFYQGSVSYFLGLLARLLGRNANAAGHLEDALAMNERIGFVPQVARTQLALAEALSEDGARGARSRANDLLAEATATARRLEMGPLLAQIDRFRGRFAASQSRIRAR
jgi:DNA-binding winged helix-turn-helix (wHTH) protein/tetratricopeptide (TPR) repeat protein